MSGLLCVTGTRGAPGASTLAVALAYTTPGDDRVVLIDADPDGGTLAPTFGVGATPGLVSLAASARHGLDTVELAAALQPVSPRFDLLAAPTGPEQASAALHRLRDSWRDLLGTTSALADVGRWRPDSPASGLVDVASAVVLVVDPTVAGVAHARAALADLTARCPRVVVAARGSRPYPPVEVAAALDVEAVWEVRPDRFAVAALGAVATGRWPRRSVLARDARQLHDASGWLTEEVPA